MPDLPAVSEVPQDGYDNIEELYKDLEETIELVENLLVQLTWMTYEVVASRLNPELTDSMNELEKAFRRCRAAVLGD